MTDKPSPARGADLAGPGRARLSACIELLFSEAAVDPSDRIRRAADAGIMAVEFWLWRNKNIEGIATALEETGVQLVSFMSEHEGLSTVTEQLVDPDQHAAFLEGLVTSTQLANRLRCGALVVHSGDGLPGVSRDRQHAAMVAALRRAGPIAGAAGVKLLLEPLNTAVDHPGHFLNTTPEGLDIVQEVDNPSVALLYDLYHSVAMGEVPSDVLAGHLHKVGHVQVADAPGRHQPGTGGVDWPRELGWLLDQGYGGLWGLEYIPSGRSPDSLVYLTAVLESLSAGNPLR